MLPNALFTLFGSEIKMYGICFAVGILSCLILLYVYTKKTNMPTKLQDFIFFIGIFAIAFGILFAMLFQAFYNFLETGVFDFYSGLTVMGGIIGGAGMFLLFYFVVGHFYFKGKDKNLHIKHLNNLLGVAPCCITLAHGFGRIGCLMSGCCHGEYLGADFVLGGIYMQGTTHGWGYYVPTQLYEALFLFLLFGVLSVLYFKRTNIVMPTYLIAYAIWRVIIEFFRADSRGVLIPGALSPSQWQSIVFFAIAVAIIVVYKLLKQPLFPKKEQLPDYKPIEEELDSEIDE